MNTSFNRTRSKTNCVRLGLVCLAVALIAGVAAISIAKWMPDKDGSKNTVEKKAHVEEMAFNVLFATNYVGDAQNQIPDITNVNDIERQLNTKTRKNRIRVISAFFRSQLTSNRMNCVKALPGHLLQLDILAPVSHDCANSDKNNCALQSQRQVQEMLKSMGSLTLRIQLNSASTKNIDVQICSTNELDKTEDQIVVESNPGPEVIETSTVAKMIKPKQGRFRPGNGRSQSMASRNARCSLCINKIGLVHMPGEFGSKIEDDIRVDVFLDDEQNRQHLTASVYEESIYRLRVQLDCGGQLDRNAFDSPCSRSLSVFAWIDYNDNDFDDRESRMLRRSWPDSASPTGAYELDIRIPTINGRDVKSGRHRMRISVIPSEEYQRECGSLTYNEIRDYTVNIYPKPRPIIITTTPYRNPFCGLNFPKIILVLMAGEKGTEIRDDIPKNSVMNNHPNRHHLAVTLFEQTIYLIRIQLDCTTQLRTDLTPTGCNLAQDVIVWIDLNNDGRFDDTEIGSPYRWPVTSYMAEGIYDLQISVPSLSNRYVANGGKHRMRIAVLPSEYYVRNCGYSSYNETREYMVDIVPRMRYSVLAALATPPMMINDFQCASDVGRVVLVVMAGEYRTQIRDDASTRAAMNMIDRVEQHRSIVLYEEVTYLLRIQLECTHQRDRGYHRTNCTLPHDVNAWIDLNDNGEFDPSENAAPYRWPLTSYVPEGVYDLQIFVPNIDNNRIKSGPHLMRVTVTLNEQYRQKCGRNYFIESRDYNVTIVRPNTKLVDTGLPYLTLNENACSQANGKIVLVIMTGELGTHIRDDTPMNTFVGENQNRHHLAVTLYENTVYRIRIQLDCDRPSSKGSYDINCNLAQDVNVWIDHNNDGTYDETESHVANRWPLHNSMGLGIYDLDISIPSINEWNMKAGTHRMRVVVMPSEEYHRKCGRSDYKEIREYTFNIIPRVAVATTYGVVRPGHCLPGNLACSNDHGAISLVKLTGERGSQIEDRERVCSSTNNYDDQRDLTVTLFDDTSYSLRIDLACARQESDYGSAYDEPSSDSSCKQASYVDVWVDFNDDNVFDDARERLTSIDRSSSDSRQAQRTLTMYIPAIDGRYYLAGQHRMRIVLNHKEPSRGPCQNGGFGEARDYTIQVVPK